MKEPLLQQEQSTPRTRYGLHILLFGLTFVTATASYGLPPALLWASERLEALSGAPLSAETGAWTALYEAFAAGHIAWLGFLDVMVSQGVKFSLSLLAILFCHEMGHYLYARRHGVDVTLPFFIPGPPLFPLPGTFGAFIRIREPIRERAALMDIGASGPIAGMVVAVPILFVGLTYSEVGPVTEQGGIYEGGSLLYVAMKYLVHGPIPAGHDVFLHPMAMAGWFGLFITALNLFPLGQLDGGHVAYALLGARAGALNRAVFGSLLGLGLGVYLAKGHPSWFLWIVLVMVIGIEHPAMIELSVPLDRARRKVGWLCMALFVLTFTPIPLSEEPPNGYAEQVSLAQEVPPGGALPRMRGEELRPGSPGQPGAAVSGVQVDLDPVAQ